MTKTLQLDDGRDSVGVDAIATYCCDAADKLTSTTDPRYTGTISYDAHGNTTLLGGQTMTYDGTDRHMSTTMGATTVRYQRDGTDRIVSRVATSPAPSVVTPHGTATGTTGTAGGTSVSVTKPGAAVTGDVMLAQVVVSGGSAVTITAPSGWTKLAGTSNSTNVQEAIYSHSLAAGETSFAFSFGATVRDAVVALAAYAGVAAPVVPIVSAASAPINTTTHTAAPVTTTGANSRVIQFVGAKAATTMATQGLEPVSRSKTYDVSSTNTTAANRVEAAIFEEGVAMAGPTAGRIVASTVATNSVNYLVALTPATGTTTTTTTRYGFSGSGDTPDYVLDASSTLTQHDVGLLGGVTITKDVITSANDVWSYPNIHGDVIMTTNNAGAWSGITNFYDPFGQALSTIPDNAKGNFDFGWLGSKQRGLEHEGALNIIEMGARQYAPGLGRLVSVDPVEGGSATDYDYAAGDSINNFDLDGNRCWLGVARTETVRYKDKKGKWKTKTKEICRSVSRGAGRALRATARGISTGARVAGDVAACAGSWLELPAGMMDIQAGGELAGVGVATGNPAAVGGGAALGTLGGYEVVRGIQDIKKNC